jgi:hypothetical protein
MDENRDVRPTSLIIGRARLLSDDRGSAGVLAWLGWKFGSPLYMTVTAFFNTVLLLTVSVAWPPLSGNAASVFFFAMNLTMPLGIPAPGLCGSTWAVSKTATTLVLLRTGWRTRITWVLARVIVNGTSADSVAA